MNRLIKSCNYLEIPPHLTVIKTPNFFNDSNNYDPDVEADSGDTTNNDQKHETTKMSASLHQGSLVCYDEISAHLPPICCCSSIE